MLRQIHQKAVEARKAEEKDNAAVLPDPQLTQEQKEARVLRRVDPDEPTPPRPRPTPRSNLSDRIEWEDFDPLMMELR
ncbi:hypothetical protein TWF506_010980 [Arthrobotrys conoides]|uniref:Uncharacterized protein n=1 Tax=Arthrobotrys conoides TaxID=74498 RepID=A0AAN8RTJ8_9PEZI